MQVGLVKDWVGVWMEQGMVSREGHKTWPEARLLKSRMKKACLKNENSLNLEVMLEF